MTNQDATAANTEDSAIVGPVVRRWKRTPKKVKAATIALPLTASIGFYQHRNKIRIFVRFPAHLGSRLEFALAGRWRLERARVIDVLANRFVDGWILVRDECGFAFYRNKDGWLGRTSDVTGAGKMKTEKLELTPNMNGFIAGPIDVAANDNTPVGGKDTRWQILGRAGSNAYPSRFIKLCRHGRMPGNSFGSFDTIR
jgi:hypothetical protein